MTDPIEERPILIHGLMGDGPGFLCAAPKSARAGWAWKSASAWQRERRCGAIRCAREPFCTSRLKTDGTFEDAGYPHKIVMLILIHPTSQNAEDAYLQVKPYEKSLSRSLERLLLILCGWWFAD